MIRFLAPSMAFFALILSACDRLPGKPGPEHHPKRPEEVTDFNVLYDQKCAACHSLDDNNLAAARPLNDPLYVAFAGVDGIREATANGAPGTTMPAYLETKGGTLTSEQVEILTRGIVERAGNVPTEKLPPYTAAPGDPLAGAGVFTVYCASCHGPDGTGGEKAGSIVDPHFLSLVSDQGLRTAVVLGRKDLGMPDWRSYVSGRTMTDKEIADVVAWLASKRPAIDSPATANTNGENVQHEL